MTKYIELTTAVFEYPICFETTGIKVQAVSKDRYGAAVVNGVSVIEKFNDILYMLQSK